MKQGCGCEIQRGAARSFVHEGVLPRDKVEVKDGKFRQGGSRGVFGEERMTESGYHRRGSDRDEVLWRGTWIEKALNTKKRGRGGASDSETTDTCTCTATLGTAELFRVLAAKAESPPRCALESENSPKRFVAYILYPSRPGLEHVSGGWSTFQPLEH